MCVARRERSASAARAQRELSAPAPAHEGASTQKPAARTAELGAAAAAAAARGTSTHPRTKPVAPALARRLRQVRVEATRKPAPPALVPACAAACRPMRNAARATARRAVAVHPHVGARPRNTRAWRDTREGGRSTTTPLPCMRACTCVRSTQPQEQEARLERPSSPPRSRPAASDQAHRASSVGPHLKGGRGERRHFTLDDMLEKFWSRHWK